MSFLQTVLMAVLISFAFFGGYIYGHQSAHREVLDAVVGEIKKRNPNMSEEEIIKSLKKENPSDE